MTAPNGLAPRNSEIIQPCGDFGAHAPILISGQGDGRHDFPDKLMEVAPVVQIVQGQFQLGLGGM